MKSFIKTILKFTTVVIFLFIMIVAIINTSPFDEELNPEIQKIMQDVPMPVVEGNAYYALMGMSANADTDIIKTGHKLILRYLENRKNGNDDLTTNDYNEILGDKDSDDSNWHIELSSCDFKTNLNCLSHYSEKMTHEFLNKPRLKTMLKRYHEIIVLNVYSNFLDTTMKSPLAAYSYMIRLSKIKLASAYQPENRSEFIKVLHKDLQFWKMMLNQGGYLIDKMIAEAGIRIDINSLSEYIRNNPISESDLHLIYEMLTPLNPKELDISESFLAESRSYLNLLDNSENSISWYENLILQPNATINLYYDKQLTKLIQLGQLPLKDLMKVRNSGVVDSDSGYKLHYLYNFMGKTLFNYNSVGAYTDYIVRGHDLNNIIKMVNIQFQAKLTDQQSIQQLLLQPKNANLFNNKPFEYDEESQLLHFECLTHYSECKIKL